MKVFSSPHVASLAFLVSCALLPTLATAGEVSPSKNPPPVPEFDWKERTIAPVTNPIFFEDAIIRSEIRPIFVYHNIDDDFLGGGNAQLYALQIRYAVTDRLAIIATQDGYLDIDNDALGDPNGWMDIAFGLKYALIDDKAHEFILTPGFTFQIPSGSSDVFQGRGGGEWNFFVSAQKGFKDLHLSTNLGFRLPNQVEEQSTIFHYSFMVDYYVCQYFIPFVSFNGFTVVSAGNNIALETEGYDIINFGSSLSEGSTQATVGVGFRSRLLDNLDLGFGYERAVVNPKGLTEDRFTTDLCIRF